MKDIYYYGERNADLILLQMCDDHDMELIEQEYGLIRYGMNEDFLLAAVKVSDWNSDLSPWKAPAVFGNDDFGGMAEDTLCCIENRIIPQILDGRRTDDVRICIGGYSLAALFALWAAYNSDLFCAVAAASPSVWFPGFCDYMRAHSIHARNVALSLGDREEKTRNPVMATVGAAIREACSTLTEQGVNCSLVWNSGNHFKDPDRRTAEAFCRAAARE